MTTSEKNEEKTKKSTSANSTKTGTTGTTRRRKSSVAGAKKNFILDTNVILHDYNCLDNFEENDIYIPFMVLEELDKFKKGSDQINFNARAFVRELDLITDDDLFTNGADLGVFHPFRDHLDARSHRAVHEGAADRAVPHPESD